MQMIWLPDWLPLPSGPVFQLLALAVRVLVAVLAGYLAKKKGYNFWVFLVIGILLEPLAALVFSLALPKIVRFVGEGEVEVYPNM
ncbi:MAG: hypothetical protein HFJ72_03520 [Adlercreutzia sp.]|nr:hypothetical protein [Adlercreutzia sp.]